MNLQKDQVHLIILVPPKAAISYSIGRVKGQTAFKLLKQFRYLRQKPYWGNHLRSKGYCVDTVGLAADVASCGSRMGAYFIYSRNCQTFAVSPAKPGVYPDQLRPTPQIKNHAYKLKRAFMFPPNIFSLSSSGISRPSIPPI